MQDKWHENWVYSTALGNVLVPFCLSNQQGLVWRKLILAKFAFASFVAIIEFMWKSFQELQHLITPIYLLILCLVKYFSFLTNAVFLISTQIVATTQKCSSFWLSSICKS